jgi:hypothetical protein
MRPLAIRGPLELTRAVIREQGLADPAFVTLLDGMITGKPVPPSTIRYPDSIHVVMMGKQQLALTPEIATGLGSPASLLAATSMTTPRPVRVVAAERLLRMGALPTPCARGHSGFRDIHRTRTRWRSGARSHRAVMNGLSRFEPRFKAATTGCRTCGASARQL